MRVMTKKKYMVGKCLAASCTNYAVFFERSSLVISTSAHCQISTSILRLSFFTLALFSRHAPANGTLSEFVFEHGVVAGTGTPEFFTGDNMAQVDEYKAYTEKAEYDGKHEEEFHCMENLNAKVNNLSNNGGGGRVAAKYRQVPATSVAESRQYEAGRTRRIIRSS